MRLVDADAFLQNLINCKIGRKSLEEVVKAVKEQPTAYDRDKVVGRLEKYLFEKYCVEGDAEIERIVKGGGVDG